MKIKEDWRNELAKAAKAGTGKLTVYPGGEAKLARIDAAEFHMDNLNRYKEWKRLCLVLLFHFLRAGRVPMLDKTCTRFELVAVWPKGQEEADLVFRFFRPMTVGTKRRVMSFDHLLGKVPVQCAS